MRECPIIFSAPMVRAILEGRKTQTRRLPTSMWANAHMRLADGEDVRLWVREMWCYGACLNLRPPSLATPHGTVSFAAGHDLPSPEVRWRSSRCGAQ